MARTLQHLPGRPLLDQDPVLEHGDADADLLPIRGNPPSLINLPPGCAFHPRCRYAGRNGDRSRTEVPELRPAREPGHLVACHLPEAERVREYAAVARV